MGFNSAFKGLILFITKLYSQLHFFLSWYEAITYTGVGCWKKKCAAYRHISEGNKKLNVSSHHQNVTRSIVR